MKKTLLLSVVASTMIMAGGDIAPVEPVVETPVVAASGWDFNGNAVAYYQTSDAYGTSDLGSGNSSFNDLGLQLRAVNKDLFYGIGAGVELTGVYSNDDFSNLRIQDGGNHSTPTDSRNFGAALTQAYLTYGMGNTSLKVGRQHLPKGLSPFAFTEGWQPIKNSFDAALVVNSDLPDTTLVYAAVAKSNGSFTGGNGTDIGAFRKINNEGDIVHMLTAQNKSIDGLTLTGSYYYSPDHLVTEDVNVLWGDAKFKISDYTIALQGGTVMGPDDVGGKDTTGFGAKIGGNFGMFDASVAYSSVDEGTVAIHNLGTGVKTPLYTQAILNQNFIKTDSDTFLVKVGAKALGGKFGAYYNHSELGDDNFASNVDSYDEFALTYKAKVTENTTVFAAYVNQELDGKDDNNNFARVWARYNF